MSDTPYYVVWCRKTYGNIQKYEEDWDCFYKYEDAVEKYERLSTNKDVDNLKITHVVKEKEIGVNPQEYYV
jgi:hypothetical protein